MEKRKISILIPYRRLNTGIQVFLQKRDKDAKRLPDYFGFFGGGAQEGETPEETLKREIREELTFDVVAPNFIGRYEFDRDVRYVYIHEAGEAFEKEIRVMEGQYGKWFSEDDALVEEKMIDEDKEVLRGVLTELRVGLLE